MHVDITTHEARRLATVRHLGPYNQIGQAFGQLCEALGPALEQLAAAGAAMMALYHDDPDHVPPDQLRSDAAVVVPEGLALPAGLVEQRLPAGRYASVLHVGPYDQLGDAWSRFKREWLLGSGERLAATPCCEAYENDPETTPPAELRTRMYMPLA